MNIRLMHTFRLTGPWDKLLEDVDNLEKFMRRIEKFCDKDTDHLSDPAEVDKRKNKFRGDAFEVFAEALLKTHAYDRRVGIANYRPADPTEDYGIDGYGIGTNMRPATVQVKYRGNGESELTANSDHLTNFLGASQNHSTHRVSIDDNENMLIITSAKGVHRVTAENMLHNKVRWVGRELLKELVDNNLPFWEEFRRATLTLTK
jgi:hypothetical protein